MNLFRTAVILGIAGLSISFSAVTAAEEKGLNPLEQCYQSVGDAPRTEIAGCPDAKLNAGIVMMQLSAVVVPAIS